MADMTRRSFVRSAALGAAGAALSLALAGCSQQPDAANSAPSQQDGEASSSSEESSKASGSSSRSAISTPTSADVTRGTDTYRGFTVDNVLHDPDDGDIHFSIYVPKSYDGSRQVALFMTLPGYQGLYVNGVNENLRTEDFAFTAQDYDPDMIVVAPQLMDWNDTSARQAIALVRYLMDEYRIDPARVYLEGYSGGGETLSLVMGRAPELFCAALFCSSQWDGSIEALTKARVPVYLVVGESDEYYGSGPATEAARRMRDALRADGASEGEIKRLVTLDVKPASYYEQGGVTNQHGGGGQLFSHDRSIMGWLFGHSKGRS